MLRKNEKYKNQTAAGRWSDKGTSMIFSFGVYYFLKINKGNRSVCEAEGGYLCDL